MLGGVDPWPSEPLDHRYRPPIPPYQPAPADHPRRELGLPVDGPGVVAVYYVQFLTLIAFAAVMGWMLKDKDRQGLHDKFAGVIVVQARQHVDLMPQ